MKSMDSFPHMLNEIFSEFNEASAIRISFDHRSKQQKGKQFPLFKLTGVNGFTSFKTFAHHLFDLKARLLEQLMDAQRDMDEQGKCLFLRQAVVRCRKFISVTIPLHVPEEYGYKNTILRQHSVFYHPSFIPDKGQTPGEDVLKKVLFLARRHAYMWRILVEELLDELHCFVCLVEFLPVLSIPSNATGNTGKLPVRISVEMLGATARMFFEFNAFDLDNKSELCRMIAQKFRTPHQKEISVKSLKNHFDVPTPETVKLLCDELRKMTNNFPKNILNN